MSGLKPRRSSPALLVAFVALFVALGGGGALAASKLIVHSNNIANGAVTNHKLAQGSVGLQKLKTPVRAAIAKISGRAIVGAQGPQGPQGATGATGATGAPGQQGAPGKSVADETTSVVYSNLPSNLPASLASEAYEATQTSEQGGLIQLAAGARTNPLISTVLDNYACENGGTGGSSTCTTADPGSSYSTPLTLNIYSVGPNNSVGSLLATDTQDFAIPYRQSDSASCTGDRYATSDGVCHTNSAVPVTFDLGGFHTTLPSQVIVSFALNTVDYGGDPTHAAETSPYNALNLGLIDNTSPSVGSDPAANTYYETTATQGDTNGHVNVFGPDVAASPTDSAGFGDGASGYYQPAISVSTTG